MSARRALTGNVANTVLIGVALAAALSLHLYWLWPHTRVADNDFDAVHLYLPLGRQLLEEGPWFFANERSIQAPPFSYVYPLLAGLDIQRLKIVNALLSCVTLVLVFRTTWLAHSMTAGVVAAFLFAASPLLRFYVASPITEPPFLLLNALWVWGLLEWLLHRRLAALALSAFAISLAVMTRATMFYWLVALTAGFCWLAWRSADDRDRRAARGAFGAHMASLALPLAFIVKNAVLFDFPFFATGGGNALYLGNNPLTGGYDANYLGLHYDVGSIARDQSHLTLEAERLLGGVALFMIGELDRSFLAWMHLKKLAAFIFVTSAEPAVNIWRPWRIAMIVLAIAGAFHVKHRWVRALLIGILVYQVLAHVPVLYTHRYSVSAIDLWLVILAAIGLAAIFFTVRAKLAFMVVTVAVAAISAGQYCLSHFDRPQPDVFRAARIRMWTGSPLSHTFGPSSPPVEIPVHVTSPEFHRWANYVVVLELDRGASATREECGRVEMAYKRADLTQYSQNVVRRIPREPSTPIQVGGVPLKLNGPGMLRLNIKCERPMPIRVTRLEIHAPMGSIDFRERFLGEAPLFPELFER